MVEDVQEQDGRSRFITERQRESRADDADLRSRPEVDRDDGGPDLVIETASGPHFQDDSARRRPRDGGLVIIVVVQVQAAQKWFLTDQSSVDGCGFRRVEIDSTRQRVSEHVAKPGGKSAMPLLFSSRASVHARDRGVFDIRSRQLCDISTMSP